MDGIRLLPKLKNKIYSDTNPRSNKVILEIEIYLE